MARRALWTLLAPKTLLKQFLLVYILRRHSAYMAYESMAAKWPDLFEHFPICISTCEGANADPRFETVTVDVLHVLSTMKINIEDSDFCSQLQDQIWDNIRGHTGLFVEQLVTLSITYFGSRYFHRILISGFEVFNAPSVACSNISLQDQGFIYVCDYAAGGSCVLRPRQTCGGESLDPGDRTSAG